MLDSRLPDGNYFIRPIDAPEGGLSIRPSDITTSPGIPVVVGKDSQLWYIKNLQNGNVNVFSGRTLTKPVPFAWFNKDNALFVTRGRPAGEFRIEAAGGGLWVIGIPNQDLLLTYDANAYPQLTFKHADGTPAQRFEFKLVRPGLDQRD